MKKRIGIIILVLALISVFALASCSYDYASSDIETKEFSADGMTAILNDFVETCGDRTSFSSKEKEAAEYIKNKLTAFDGITCEYQDFTYEYSYSGSFLTASSIKHTFSSQNVIGTLAGKNSNGKKIVIGAYYDNLYSYGDLYEGYHRVNGLNYTSAGTGTAAEGALGATGAAASLALAEKLSAYNAAEGLPFDVEFVYFGAEQFGCRGSQAYGGSSRINSAHLFINLSRIGGDNIYAYFDEVETAYGSLIMDNAANLGYGEIITEPSSLQTVINASSTGGELPYTNYSLLGASGVMFGAGIKVCNFTTGVFDSFVLSDKESLSYDNIADTADDKLSRLSGLCPQYALQMAVIADTVYASVIDGRLIAALGEEPYDYKWLTFPLAGALSVIGLVLVLAVVLIILVRHFEKKHPYVITKPKKVKMAVFGMDYENPADADVFIDTKPHAAGDRFDPFAGNGEENADSDKKEE